MPQASRRFTPPRGVAEIRLPDGRLAVVGLDVGDAIEVERLDRLLGEERQQAEAMLLWRSQR